MWMVDFIYNDCKESPLRKSEVPSESLFFVYPARDDMRRGPTVAAGISGGDLNRGAILQIRIGREGKTQRARVRRIRAPVWNTAGAVVASDLVASAIAVDVKFAADVRPAVVVRRCH